MSEDKPESFPIDNIHVPVKRKKELKPEVVQEVAASILEIGQQTPILIRADGDHFILVEGLHRLEACKALGESNILGVVVSAEFAHHKAVLIDSAEMEAERDKMARLKRLRLEKEAAENAKKLAAAPEKFAVASKPVTATKAAETPPERNRPSEKIANKPKTPNRRGSKTQVSRPTTLSEWITQQKDGGGRY